MSTQTGSFKWLKRIGLFFAFLFGLLLILYFVYNEPKPQVVASADADVLAQKMLKAVNKEAWDTTAVLQWTFKGVHSYLWDKQRNYAQITWGEHKAQLRLDEVDGKVWKNDVELTGEEAQKGIQTAWSYWCNDSFWFNAVVKAFDKGTSRSIVKQEDGSDALMVTYESGGVTPGDSYLWILDENGLPKSWKMWVSIIPVGGMEFTWEKWTSLETGAKISTFHKSSALDLDMSNVKGAASLEAFGLNEDPFSAIKK